MRSLLGSLRYPWQFGRTAASTGNRHKAMSRTQLLVLMTVAASVLCSGLSFAEEDNDELDFLAEMSLEELLDVEVTSVSKKAEKRSDAAAAIFVITNDDIRRSGVTSIPEALRMVPGMSVARQDQNKWSVSSRGFSGRFANKLLVLIDGRSVYTPLFSGVYWEVQDVMLEDVDRIEVIRGPGGTLWGANAVNGVINIVTKKAEDTQGGLISAGVGTEERGFGNIRFGGVIGDEKAFYRVHGGFLDRDEGANGPVGEARDESRLQRGGFRTDITLTDSDQLTIQGDYFNSETDDQVILLSPTAPQIVPTDNTSDFEGFNVLTRWNRQLSEESDLQLQLYHDYYKSRGVTLDFEYRIYDAEFQHSFRLTDRNEIIWGVGYRLIEDDIDSTALISYSDESDSTDVLSGFVQDQFAFRDDLKLTMGVKVEHNSYTGWEVQPSARFAWTPENKGTLWGSVSRAVRTPSRSEDDIQLVSAAQPPGALPVPFDTFPSLLSFIGSDDYKSEELLAFELGYRFSPADNWLVDATTYFNIYDNLRTVTPGTPFAGPLPNSPLPANHIIIPLAVGNDMDAEAFGAEVLVDWKPISWLRLRGSYSFFEIDVDPGPTALLANVQEGGDFPEQQAYIEGHFDLPRNVEFDVTLRYTDRLPDLDVNDFVTADARIGWKPRENLELAIVAQNLLEPDHNEFEPSLVNSVATQVQRSVYGKVTLEF